MMVQVETKTASPHTVAVDMIGELLFANLLSEFEEKKKCRAGGTHPFLNMNVGGMQLSVGEARTLMERGLGVMNIHN